VLFLIPGTLGRGDVFWQQITALNGRLRIIATSYPATGGVADWKKLSKHCGSLIAVAGCECVAAKNGDKGVSFN
jgi:hypothetical protein